MRIFWVLIGLIAVLSAAAVAYSFGGAQRTAEATLAAEKERRAIDRRAAEAADIVARGAELEAQVPPAPPAPKVEPKAEPKPTPAPAQPAPAAPPVPASPAAAARALPELPDVIGEYLVVPCTMAWREDGALLVDGTYVVKGEGTLEKPYEITWEQLTSASDTFDPKGGKKRIPGRVALLHDKVIKVSGFIAYPLMVKEPRECLAMLNQWDGCCIGVPPTPYDALEVTLAKPATGNDRYALAGSVTGIFEVKPYVTGDWLVGLYLLNRATMKATDFGGPASN